MLLFSNIYLILKVILQVYKTFTIVTYFTFVLHNLRTDEMFLISEHFEILIFIQSVNQ